MAYNVSMEGMSSDLQKEKPLWPLSSYGPAKGQQTIVPGLDESPEEMRVKAFEAAKAGTTSEYVCGIVVRSHAQ